MMTKVTKIDTIVEELLGKKTDLLTLEELVDLHARIKSLTRVERDIKNHIINALLSGATIRGYKLVKTKGKRNISDPVEATKRLMDYVKAHRPDLDYTSVVSPVSLDTLQKTLSPEVVAELLSDVIDNGAEGKSYEFVPDTDKRQAIKIE